MSQQLARQADIYARNGLTDQAEQYRLKAYDVSRQEEQDARTREADARTKADYEQKQNTNNAAQWMAEQISSGRTADMTLIAEAQTKFKGNYDTLLSTTANVLGITDKIAKQKTDQLVNQINEAVLGGEASFNKLLGSFADPNKEDDITPKLMQVKGGVQVMYGNKPMSPVFTGADGISPLQQAGAFYINTAQGKPFETAIQMQNLAKGKATIAAENARASSYGKTKDSAPVILVNEKNEPTPVVMSDLPRVNGVVQLPKGLRMPKDVQQATAAQNRVYDSLTKTDAWERAERAGDTAKMNELMVNRGLDPVQFGGTGMKGWGEQGGAATPAATPGQPAQQSMAAPARTPSAGLMTPQQLSAAQQQQQAQVQGQQQQNTAAGVRASGLGREEFMLREEAAGYTPIVIQQMTPRQADEFRRRYGRYLTPEQTRAVNQAM
jgi:hypothetical protein